MSNNIDLLNRLAKEGNEFNFDNFSTKSVRGYPRHLSAEWIAWTTRIKLIIERDFEEGSAPYELLKTILPIVLVGNGVQEFEAAHTRYRHLLDLALEALHVDQYGEGKVTGPTDAKVKTNKVFIVHGHDDRAKQELEILLREMGLEPIVLHRQVDEGQTIIEKFERHSDVGYAFALLTPDDIAYQASQDSLSDSEKKKELRARQNVILEYGYFIGRLGRANVCCVCTGSVALPSDMQGLIYKRYTNSIEEVAYSIGKELKARGYDIR